MRFPAGTGRHGLFRHLFSRSKAPNFGGQYIAGTGLYLGNSRVCCDCTMKTGLVGLVAVLVGGAAGITVSHQSEPTKPIWPSEFSAVRSFLDHDLSSLERLPAVLHSAMAASDRPCEALTDSCHSHLAFFQRSPTSATPLVGSSTRTRTRYLPVRQNRST